MAKGQKHGNREIKKPKKKKEAVTAPSPLTKGMTASIGVPKKKS
ncbi:MAG: hypothetical protein ACLPID_14950 [Beijerinckiaceae bacterium]